MAEPGLSQNTCIGSVFQFYPQSRRALNWSSQVHARPLQVWGEDHPPCGLVKSAGQADPDAFKKQVTVQLHLVPKACSQRRHRFLWVGGSLQSFLGKKPATRICNGDRSLDWA